MIVPSSNHIRTTACGRGGLCKLGEDYLGARPLRTPDQLAAAAADYHPHHPTDQTPPKLHPPPFINAVSAQVSKNALDVWGLDKESALHRFFVGEPVSVVAASPDGTHFAAGALSGAE